MALLKVGGDVIVSASAWIETSQMEANAEININRQTSERGEATFIKNPILFLFLELLKTRSALFLTLE